MLRLCSCLVLVLLAGPLEAQTIIGRAKVGDGDTLTVAGETIRLFGIDAPERGQTCAGEDGLPWPCGAWAREMLAEMVAGRQVTCAGRERDRYGRLVAVCTTGGQDIGKAMVEQGAAHAYRKYALDYVDAEKRAFVAARGVWKGDHIAPETYRAGQSPALQQVPSSGCAIKGNVSKAGRIYHRPGQRDYAATRIDPRKGERWFCSEAEARAAGWRAARR